MAKKGSNAAAAKALKKAKTSQKTEKKVAKVATKTKKQSKNSKGYDSDSDGEDLEGILEKMRKDWENAHKVTEELVEGPPSRRANATLTACPNGGHLWCIGGEFFSDDGRAYFYNDVFRYTPEKGEWRKFVSPTCPGPRSAHAVVASPIGGGKLFLFGGEFSSLHQTTFRHYRDFWCFDIPTHSWDRIETKITPSARSGHRMAIWKHYIVLFGGFYDPGITTRYLNDLWLFDTQEYRWQQVEFKPTDVKPSPRSGFSFLPCTDGIILHGGYCKEYVKGKRPVGVMLDDTWLLKISFPSESSGTTPASTKPSTSTNKPTSLAKSSAKGNPSKAGNGTSLVIKWERRKQPSDAFAPSIRSGCTMALWSAKSMGVLFGGVTDEDKHEETLESVFHNDLFGYQLTGKGKWSSFALRKPKAKGGKKKKKNTKGKPRDDSGDDSDDDDGAQVHDNTPVPSNAPTSDDPMLTVPLPRYNTMLAVLRNTLYIYGGIFERGSREYTLDDFHSLQLDKLDRYVCLKASDVVIPDGEEESSEDEDEDDDDDDYDDDDDDDGVDENENEEENEEAEGMDVSDSEETRIDADVSPPTKDDEDKDGGDDMEPVNELRQKATTFMGVSKDAARSPEDVMSTPLPGETLAMFYARTREYWAQRVVATSDHRGKELRRDGFAVAEDRYASYKPILEEVERILAEAGLDEEEMRRSAAAGGPASSESGISRNRR